MEVNKNYFNELKLIEGRFPEMIMNLLFLHILVVTVLKIMPLARV